MVPSESIYVTVLPKDSNAPYKVKLSISYFSQKNKTETSLNSRDNAFYQVLQQLANYVPY